MSEQTPGGVLEAEGIVVEYGRRPALRAVDGVSFTVAAGEVVALVGESGCGKTTLLNAMSALIDPTERVITIEDAAELRTFLRKGKKIIVTTVQKFPWVLDEIGAVGARQYTVHRGQGPVAD